MPNKLTTFTIRLFHKVYFVFISFIQKNKGSGCQTAPFFVYCNSKNKLNVNKRNYGITTKTH